MKTGIIANSELCMPLLHYLKQNNAGPVVYLGLHEAVADINSLLSFCNNNSIAVEIENDPEQLFSWLNVQQPDYCFVFGYKNLIDVNRLGPFGHRIFNIHPGKLPQYRGPTPVFWQLKNGEAMLGLTIHFIEGKYDSGGIVWSREINNEAHFSHGLVDFIFSNILIEGVLDVINTGTEGLLKRQAVQEESKAVSYKRPTLQDVLIRWQAMHAAEVVNLVKACNPWNKGAITMCNNMEVKIVDAEMPGIKTGETAGTIIDLKDGLKVACAGNTVVNLHHLNISGMFVPGRFAEKFGFAAGQRFASP